MIVQKNNNRNAFTLAEVLITLGVIGIIAAMTLPTLLNKYNEQVTVTKVKKFYSTINQALLFAIKNNGTVDTWDYIEKDEENDSILSNKLANYLKPYLKISKDCGIEKGCIGNNHYYDLSNNIWNAYGLSPMYYKLILNDGSFLWIRRNLYLPDSPCADTDGGYKNTCGVIWFDVNGSKQPNIIGKDTFVFIVLKDRIMPHNGYCSTQDKDNNPSSPFGWGCARHILQYGNMNYLH